MVSLSDNSGRASRLCNVLKCWIKRHWIWIYNPPVCNSYFSSDEVDPFSESLILLVCWPWRIGPPLSSPDMLSNTTDRWMSESSSIDAREDEFDIIRGILFKSLSVISKGNEFDDGAVLGFVVHQALKSLYRFQLKLRAGTMMCIPTTR